MRLLRTIASLALAVLALAATASEARAQASCGIATNTCFEVNLVGAGCNNPECCGLVCSIEPGCCDIAWDGLCVALAEKFCSSCGATKDSCFTPHPAPSCSDGLVCEIVCGTVGFEYCCVTSWDQGCANLAIQLTGNCGAPAAGSCLAVHERPYCADTECCTDVCSIDPNCCSLGWDERCVEWANRVCFTCGSPRAGSCCHQHGNPYCSDRTCCETICLTDAFCCESRWDSFCAQTATQVCGPCQQICGYTDPANPNARACRSVHPQPGCSDAVCCDEVCAYDSFCCAISWDYTCVEVARAICALTPDPVINELCSLSNGSCFIPHTTPGCEDASCCGTVCAGDPFCCDVNGAGWDEACAARAAELCNGCGSLTAGSCLYPHGTPACIDRECCNIVCDADPPCCTAEWDVFCVNGANLLCQDILIEGGDPRTRPCSIASFLPACEDARCCEAVCLFDPTCCSRAWDETCAAATRFACPELIPNNCPGPGSPLTVHAQPGCSDIECCSAVCATDPLCCSLGWSQRCVDVAKEICWSFGVCPGEEACDRSHQSPGCSDATCCSIVCDADPLCCEVQWNSPCVTLATNLCSNIRPNWECPCAGSCFEPHATPGCQDQVCCVGVCNEDPTCCITEWDARCATLARVICCSFANGGCGDSCAGDCLTPHQTPHCNDPACCEAVCRIEPYCCDTRWDSSCVLRARETCLTLYVGNPKKPHESVGGCGQLVSGSCYASHFWPGCSDGNCCVLVCDADPSCCDTEWDETCAGSARTLCESSIPDCGDVGLNGCNVPHNSPSCADRDCCTAVCAIDEFCCTEQWDQTCVTSAFDTDGCQAYQFGCGDICSGSCCEAHSTPWCDDQACCEAVKRIDAFCVTDRWDEFCAATARLIPECEVACPDPKCGTPEAGNCCFAHDSANCSDQDCCDAVCAIDTFCCESVWDPQCANLAVLNCAVCAGGLSCGDPDAGSCCNEHAEPYCNDLKCCEAVCVFDFGCCTVEWDTTCVKIAQAICGCQ